MIQTGGVCVCWTNMCSLMEATDENLRTEKEGLASSLFSCMYTIYPIVNSHIACNREKLPILWVSDVKWLLPYAFGFGR
jgi:hypothetical protein